MITGVAVDNAYQLKQVKIPAFPNRHAEVKCLVRKSEACQCASHFDHRYTLLCDFVLHTYTYILLGAYATGQYHDQLRPHTVEFILDVHITIRPARRALFGIAAPLHLEAIFGRAACIGRMSGTSLAAVRSAARGTRNSSQTFQQVLRLVHNASVGLPTTSRAAALWAREFSGAAKVGQPIILRRQVSLLSFFIAELGAMAVLCRRKEADG